ncbi:hypothetical protein GIB67_024417 [Kingdonia uniflora]|uniref:Uncharacterized protein n=1 Tax=Kingdonia uniflora TaxID=39325 RepID=A0A7J7MHP1_9MAGN|nr:hypothetical protein GIB67_024417 [Kingdonia uniflora]
MGQAIADFLTDFPVEDPELEERDPTSLLDMNGKYGVVDQWLRILFDEMLEKNGVSWNAMIALIILAGCTGISDLKMGMQVHGYLVVVGMENECASGPCNMHFRCRNIVLAERVFQEREGHGIVVSALTACSNLCLLLVGRQVQGLIVTLHGIQMDFKSKDGSKDSFLEEGKDSFFGRMLNANNIRAEMVTRYKISPFINSGRDWSGKERWYILHDETGKAPIILNMSTFIVLG